MKSNPAIEYLFDLLIKQQLKAIINIIDRHGNHMQFCIIFLFFLFIYLFFSVNVIFCQS